MRTLICGPLELDDMPFVEKVLNRVTFEFDDVVLITDLRPGLEYHATPTSFPIAEEWLRRRWLRHVRRGLDRTKYSKSVRHYAPYEGKKQQTQGVKEQRLKMVQDAAHCIVFWDAGRVDDHTQAIYDLSRLFDLTIKRILI